MPCQGDFLAGFTFVGIHDFDIPLRGGDTLVRHDALYGADVRPGSSLQRGECSPVRVECDVLGNSGRTNPLFHRYLRPATHKPLEYQTFLFRTIANQSQSFFTDGNDVFRLVLLRNDVYAFSSGRIVHDVLDRKSVV